MTRLFEQDDWSRFDGAEIDAPSILADTFDRDTRVSTEPDTSCNSTNVLDVYEPSPIEYDYLPEPALPTAPAIPSTYDWYTDWSTGQSAPPETEHDPGIDLREDTRYDPYDPFAAHRTHDSWDPLTDPWPVDKQLAEPRLAPSQPTAGLVYPEAGYSEAQYVETRYVETQCVDSYVEQPYAESLPTQASQPTWLREPLPGVPTQGRFDDSALTQPAVSAPTAPATSDPQEYDVVLPGPLGDLEVGFRDGTWYSLSNEAPRRLHLREVLATYPQHAGAIVQVVCWWMRENGDSVRAVDLATELALAVSDFARGGSGVRRAS